MAEVTMALLTFWGVAEGCCRRGANEVEGRGVGWWEAV